MKKNIFITGRPGCGKTTLIKELLISLKIKAGGFYTEEIREKGKRVGFLIRTLNGKEGLLSHINFKSNKRIGKYKINLSDLDNIATASILEATITKELIVIDEIGPMEVISKKFRQVLYKALDAHKTVLATIKLKGNKFIEDLKKRQDIELISLNKNNFREIKNKITTLLYN